MAIEDLFDWYQKKIGSYDKQLWEKTLEQKIIHGLTHIQMKSAKPKTDLIDLDLVRGSSFTKAKPKHGFITVARHATLRLIFLPLYAKWWVRQTSGKIFALVLLLYLSEFVNIGIYFYNTARLPPESPTVPSTEIVIPIVMMWVLSVIHSEIVATNPGPEQKTPQVQSMRSYKKHRSKNKRTRVTKRTKEKPVVIEEHENEVSATVAAHSSDSDSQREGGDNTNRQPAVEKDDDGFESLNGNGSSPSDNFEDVAASTPTNQNSKCDAWVRSLCERTTVKLSRQQSAPVLFRDSSGAESDDESNLRAPPPKLSMRRNSQIPIVNINIDSTCDTEDDAFSSPDAGMSFPLYAEATTSATDWCGVTTNSEDCSYSSEYETDSNIDASQRFEFELTPTAILSPCCSASDRVSCTIWEHNEIKKADLSVFDISSAIISKVELMPQSMDYFYVGVVISTILSVLPATYRFCNTCTDLSPNNSPNNESNNFIAVGTPELMLGHFPETLHVVIESAFGSAWWERTVILIASAQRWVLASAFFFLLAVAERTFKQRFLYAKLFAHLTSARRAKKSELPHFRLNKVRNIKTWLSVRSYLRKRGLQRSVDVIVSAAFITTLLLLSFLSVELLKDTVGLHSQYNLEAMVWCFGLGILLLRFMTLGTEINKKYRNLSLLITEQINLYLQIEQKPEKKNELMVANSVLKLAADLLKELESPFKISGLSANPYLYNITKVVILSALSGVLSDMLGFKLKLHKIKVK